MQPPPARRERLPTPKQHEKSVSLWSILKECVGKDLSRICLPVYFNEPLSVLQKTVEDLEYADLLNKVLLVGIVLFLIYISCAVCQPPCNSATDWRCNLQLDLPVRCAMTSFSGA